MFPAARLMELLPTCTGALYIAALTVLVATMLAALLRFPKYCVQKSPPGPRSWPLLGSLNFSTARIDPREALKWAKKYGSIVGLKKGSVDVVILSDYEEIKEYFSMPELQFRPTTWGLHAAEKGLTVFNGEEWKQNRDFSMRALAKLGLGSTAMRQHIGEEACHLADTLGSRRGSPVAALAYIQRAFLNCMCRYLLGYRYDLEDPRRKALDDALSGFRLQAAAAPAEHRAAWLRRAIIDRLCPTSTSASRRRLLTALHTVARLLVAANNEFKPGERQNSYIDIYTERMREAAKENNPYFRADALIGNIVDLLTGAATSGPLYMHWTLLNIAARTDTLQAELHQEIDSVVGFDRSPKWEDHTRMPLTMATIWEMFRWKVAAPFNIPRGTGEDTKFGEYQVRKGTMVFPNLLAVHRDPKLWTNPDKFDPSRFLKPDGTAQTTRPEGLLNFSVGRRMCPGEGMAMVEMFLVLTTLLHRFRILPEEGQTINIPPLGPSLELAETKLRFIPRNRN
ncbi:hypothetical protein V5799_018173 [Amblyomma americanum]|uniref:Cytochrome n=1 Tax=Amblyomma americanum TaxID=6943 RepID=A0AAQ4F065_AMBAM